MEFIDLKAQYAALKTGIDQRIHAVLDHGRYINGPEVAELEAQLAEFVGVKHCIGVSNGTDALMIALMSIGIEPGDEVITTDFSFFATAETIAILGAVPVFVDIDPDTYNIDTNLIAAAITDKTKAIIPVSLYGQCADLLAIQKIAHEHGLAVIEDAAQSFGATHHGQRSCGITDIATTSFFPSKPLGCYGDGGAIFTNHDHIAEIIREIHIHGQSARYQHSRIGTNGRLDTLQAAILLEKFKAFPAEIAARQRIAAAYHQKLAPEIKRTRILDCNTSVYAQFTIEVEDRSHVVSELSARKIPTAVHYPIPLQAQAPMQQYQRTRNPLSARAANHVMSLPMHPYMDDQTLSTICDAVNEATAAALCGADS